MKFVAAVAASAMVASVRRGGTSAGNIAPCVPLSSSRPVSNARSPPLRHNVFPAERQRLHVRAAAGHDLPSGKLKRLVDTFFPCRHPFFTLGIIPLISPQLNAPLPSP